MIQAQAALLFFRPVAFVARIREDRLNVFNEIDLPSCGRGQFSGIRSCSAGRLTEKVQEDRRYQDRSDPEADLRSQTALHEVNIA